jgi:hypothetical protein
MTQIPTKWFTKPQKNRYWYEKMSTSSVILA